MLWACLLFSDLPLRAVYEDDEFRQPCLVVDGPRQRPYVAFANATAKRSGAHPGRVLAAARALCSTLQARPRDCAAEQRLLLSLAAWAYRFSSQVSLAEPDALLVEVGASLRLFGGWPVLERRLREELAAIGHAAAIAVTPIPAASRVLAAERDGFFTDQPAPLQNALGFVPVAQSGLPPEAVALLDNVGVRRLRDAFTLPRPELARRIGPAAFAQLDRLRGSERQMLTLYEPPDRFEHRIELDDRIEAWPPLLFPLRRLCGELALFLAARDGGVQRCELVLGHEDTAATRMTVELLTPQREARVLYELVRNRLERVALAAPVSAIALIATDLPEFSPRHQDLFEPQREQGLEWPELAERLRAHLGDDAVRRLAAAADHRPEKAWRFAAGVRDELGPRYASAPAAKKKPSAKISIPEQAITGGLVSAAAETAKIEISSSPASGVEANRLQFRPLWLLSHALPLRGPAPKILAGPERIESGWWDGGDTRRDYYVVQTRSGQRAWAFLVPGTHDSWMLHGWFA